MPKLICPLMFSHSHDTTHFLRVMIFLFWNDKVAIGFILSIERLLAQDSYDTENCYLSTIESDTHKNIRQTKQTDSIGEGEIGYTY